MSSGAVQCWGFNNHGQLGDGTNLERYTPVSVLGLSGAQAIALSSDHACALLTGGTARCWGYNGFGQLGDGTTANQLTPVNVLLSSGVTATSGVPISFSAAANCTVSGTTVHLTRAGTCTITASQGGNGNFHPATSVDRPFTIIEDNDGIEAAIDTDGGTVYGNTFSDIPLGGTTSGTITNRGTSGEPVTVTVKDVYPGGVQITATTTVTITVSTCPAGGAEQIDLDAGEVATVECANTTDTNTGSRVTAVSALLPADDPAVTVRDTSGQVQPQLAAGQSVTIGSPVTAGPDNTMPILVQLLDEQQSIFGSFSLDAAESVDVECSEGPNGATEVRVNVVVGTVTITVWGHTRTLSEGQADRFVRDVAAPVISGLAVNKPTLGPPNHKMIDMLVSYAVTDAVDASPVCSIGVSSNEPINGTGDGDTAPDWEVLDARHVRLRAERAGGGSGRTYIVTLRCTDSAGNAAAGTVVVRVPR